MAGRFMYYELVTPKQWQAGSVGEKKEPIYFSCADCGQKDAEIAGFLSTDGTYLGIAIIKREGEFFVNPAMFCRTCYAKRVDTTSVVPVDSEDAQVKKLLKAFEGTSVQVVSPENFEAASVRAHDMSGDYSECDECGATIPPVASTEINRHHATSCSLHSDNVVNLSRPMPESAWEQARRLGRRVFYEPETETVRQCPQNYCLVVRRDGQWQMDIDAASPLNAHSLGMFLADHRADDGPLLAKEIEEGFWGTLYPQDVIHG